MRSPSLQFCRQIFLIVNRLTSFASIFQYSITIRAIISLLKGITSIWSISKHHRHFKHFQAFQSIAMQSIVFDYFIHLKAFESIASKYCSISRAKFTLSIRKLIEMNLFLVLSFVYLSFAATVYCLLCSAYDKWTTFRMPFAYALEYVQINGSIVYIMRSNDSLALLFAHLIYLFGLCAFANSQVVSISAWTCALHKRSQQICI